MMTVWYFKYHFICKLISKMFAIDFHLLIASCSHWIFKFLVDRSMSMPKPIFPLFRTQFELITFLEYINRLKINNTFCLYTNNCFVVMFHLIMFLWKRKNIYSQYKTQWFIHQGQKREELTITNLKILVDSKLYLQSILFPSKTDNLEKRACVL